jgi:hypothetical protein
VDKVRIASQGPRAAEGDERVGSVHVCSFKQLWVVANLSKSISRRIRVRTVVDLPFGIAWPRS